MATDLRAVSTFPYFAAVSASPSALEIQLPSQCSQVTAGSDTAAIYIVQNGCTDGGALPAEKMFIPSNNLLAVKLGRRRSRADSLFVATGTGTATAYIILEEL